MSIQTSLRKTGTARGRLDADAHLLAHDREDRDLDLVPDHDALIGLPREYEHRAPPSMGLGLQLMRVWRTWRRERAERSESLRW